MKTDRKIMQKLLREDYVFRKLYEAREGLLNEKYKSMERFVLIGKIFLIMLDIVDQYRKDNP